MTSNDAPILMYVEDEAMVAIVGQMALEEAGFAVDHVLSGRAAIRALDGKSAAYCALVTDVRLPEVDGWNIARHARELRPTLPVVYVSGDSAAEWSSQGVPGSIMVQKPFANAQLIAAVTTLLNQTGPVSPLPDGT